MVPLYARLRALLFLDKRNDGPVGSDLIKSVRLKIARINLAKILMQQTSDFDHTYYAIARVRCWRLAI